MNGQPQQYLEVKRKAREGERIKITKIGDRTMRDMTVGKAYAVVEASDEYGCVDIVDDAGDEASAFDDSYVVLALIDGRQAKVTDAGKLFTTYRDFANKHGFPDAAAGSAWDDKRKRPKNGDAVTLLVSGAHMSGYGGKTLWIVEAADGARFIIGVDGIEIEKEPTDVIYVDGKRYRAVKRNAAVGERILSLKSEVDTTEGAVYTVTLLSGNADPHYIDDAGDRWHMNGTDEYRVLEPLTSESTPDPCATILESRVTEQAAQIDGILGTLAEVGRKLAQMETQLRVAREDIVLLGEGVHDDIKRLEREIGELRRRPAAEKSTETAAPKITRDAVIERAKADVAELLRTERFLSVPSLLDGEMESFYPGDTDEVDFVINREKRTVIALIRYTDKYKNVWAKGKARCAPGDVFNTHIGRAIALRRALGLEVPIEYEYAPQPTEAQAGDIVSINGDVCTVKRRHPEKDSYYGVGGDKAYWFEEGGFECASRFRVIDDSREEAEVSA